MANDLKVGTTLLNNGNCVCQRQLLCGVPVCEPGTHVALDTVRQGTSLERPLQRQDATGRSERATDKSVMGTGAEGLCRSVGLRVPEQNGPHARCVLVTLLSVRPVTRPGVTAQSGCPGQHGVCGHVLSLEHRESKRGLGETFMNEKHE